MSNSEDFSSSESEILPDSVSSSKYILDLNKEIFNGSHSNITLIEKSNSNNLSQQSNHIDQYKDKEEYYTYSKRIPTEKKNDILNFDYPKYKTYRKPIDYKSYINTNDNLNTYNLFKQRKQKFSYDNLMRYLYGSPSWNSEPINHGYEEIERPIEFNPLLLFDIKINDHHYSYNQENNDLDENQSKKELKIYKNKKEPDPFKIFLDELNQYNNTEN